MISKRGRIDKVLLAAVILIALLGIAFVYSATCIRSDGGGNLDPLVMKQILWVGIGFCFLFVFMNVDYVRIINSAYAAYAINLGFLVILLLVGGERYGARRWIALGPVSLQPSEFVKITVILALAAFLRDRQDKRGSLGNYMGAAFLIAPAAGLIFLQPDLGTALVLVPILFSILYICSERLKYMIVNICAAIVSMPFLWGILKDYQKNRLMVFLNPSLDPLGAGYTIIQSKIAVGSGGIFGKGWLNGTQSYLKFLPERHTDFIFSVIGEEWGFAGAVILISLYALIVWRGLRIIHKTNDISAKAIAAGIVTLIAFQVLVNISMTIGLMPVVGLPLPAISYGGSNTVATLICAGLLLGVGRRAKS
ncbi:MAG: rod shape-determining protein RodA [Candidatus Omnitrophota bacterium]